MSVSLQRPELVGTLEGRALMELFAGSIHGQAALFEGCTVVPESHGFQTFREMLEHLRGHFKRGKRLVFHELTVTAAGIWLSYAVLS